MLPAALFFAKLAAPLGRDFSWAVVAIAGVLLLLSLAFLFTTAFMDPGFIPRVDEADIETGWDVPPRFHCHASFVALLLHPGDFRAHCDVSFAILMQ